jgi:signal transduction histidine kinase
VLVDLRFARTGARLVLSARDMTETSRGEDLIARLAALAGRANADVIGFLKAAEPAFVELGWTAAYSLVETDRIVPACVLGRENDPVTIYGRSIIGNHLDADSSPIASHVVETGRAMFLDNLPRTSPLKLAAQLDRRMEEARVRRSIWCPVWSEGVIAAVLAVAGSDLTDHDFVAMQLLAAQLGAIDRTGRLQSELVRRERLAAMGETIAVVAHEIRHPLAVLLTALSILRREQNFTEQGRSSLTMMNEETSRLRRVVDDLLAASRRTELQPTAVPLLTLVSEAVAAKESVRGNAAGPAIAIGPEIAVRADRELLRRVLLNLIENALIHVPATGSIRISAHVAAGRCRLTIYNDGTPIAASIARRVFEPFFTTRPNGHGLGLFVAQLDLASMGGSVELDPTKEGVQFSVYLPIAGHE